MVDRKSEGFDRGEVQPAYYSAIFLPDVQTAFPTKEITATTKRERERERSSPSTLVGRVANRDTNREKEFGSSENSNKRKGQG